MSFEKIKLISELDHEKFYNRSNVCEGDILISMIGVNRGMSCLVDDGRIFSIKNVGLIKANDKVNMSFLLYYLKSLFSENLHRSRIPRWSTTLHWSNKTSKISNFSCPERYPTNHWL